MSWEIGLNIGESFAEILATDQQTSIFKRWYLPQESLAQFLSKFLLENPEVQADRLVVSSRFLEKIIDRKLSGNVANLVTSGFENWSWIRQPATSSHFEMHPKRSPALSNDELVFGITERTLVNGDIEQEIKNEELEFISEKLKLMEVKRVCINFLHSQKNSSNEKLVGEYFKSQGFQIFMSHELGQSLDEVPRWRRNILNACMAGVFEELLADIKRGLGDKISADKIFFWNSHGELFQNDGNEYISTLFGFAPAIHKHIQKHASLKTPYHILHLGLEFFTLINPHKVQNHWQTPWGPVDLKSIESQKLKIQPTLAIQNTDWNGWIDLGTEEVGFEPGPLCFGKSRRITLFDLFAFKNKVGQINGVEKLLNEAFQNRFKDSLLAMSKNASGTSTSLEKIIDELEAEVYSRIVQEITLLSEHKDIVCCGAFSPLIFTELKKRAPHFNWYIIKNADQVKSTATVVHSKELQK